MPSVGRDSANGAIPPSPLAGEGTRRAGEGFRAARTIWRTENTKRLRRFATYKFRRQVPIGPYIVDFLCPSARLIVERDGSQHAENPTDRSRDAWLAAQGLRMLRLWNSDLTDNRAGVLDAVWANLQEPS